MQKQSKNELTMIIAHPGRDTADKTRETAKKLHIRVVSEENSFSSLLKKLTDIPADIISLHILLPGLSEPVSFEHPVFSRLQKRPVILYACPSGASEQMKATFQPLIPASPSEEALQKAISGHYPPLPSESELMRAEKVLRYLGFTQGRARGYLSFAAGLCMFCPENAAKLSRVIYPAIASRFSVTEKHAADAMRRAVDKAFLSGDIDRQYALFQSTIDETRGKPTLSALLARVGEILRLKEDESI